MKMLGKISSNFTILISQNYAFHKSKTEIG